MIGLLHTLLIRLTCVVITTTISVVTANAEPPPDAANVAAILSQRCVACHGPEKQEGGYRADSFAKARTPGDSGALPIAFGKPERSELYRRLVTSDPDERMPAEAPALPEQQLALIKQWIEAGSELSAEADALPFASWKLPTKKAVTPDKYPAPLPVTALALEAIGDQVTLWTSGYGEVLRWRISTEASTIISRLPVAGVHVSDVDVSPSGKWMAVASGVPGSQGNVELFALHETGPQLCWSQSTRDLNVDLAISPSEEHLAVGQTDGTLLIVDINAAEPNKSAARTLAPHADAILAVNWSQSSERLITGSRDRTAKIFDAKKWQLIANYDRHERAVGGVAYLQDKPVSFDETGTLRLWSGDDSDRTVAEQGNLARFLEPVVAADKRLWLAMGARLESFQVERKTVEEGKDENGKPKQKTSTRWKQDLQLSSGQSGWLLSLDTAEKVIAAGDETGRVFVWRSEEKQPWQSFIASP